MQKIIEFYQKNKELIEKTNGLSTCKNCAVDFNLLLEIIKMSEISYCPRCKSSMYLYDDDGDIYCASCKFFEEFYSKLK